MMDTQEHNLCLINMPTIVLERIVTHVHIPSNVSRTCKYLYETVCRMEKARRVLYISLLYATSILNLDTDAVFDSIINSQRSIKEIEVSVGHLDGQVHSSYVLNVRQLARMTAIMKQFGANVTSLKLHGCVLPINFVIEILRRVLKLESLSFTYGEVMGSVTENATMSLRLTSLKALEIKKFSGLLGIVNLFPDGSLKFRRYTNQSTEVLRTVLTKQHNIKSLIFECYKSSDLTALRVDHLQLESLIFDSPELYNSGQFVEMLMGQTNLKELRFIEDFGMSESLFQWICKNLTNLEVFEVERVDSIKVDSFEMLSKLKKLQHFRRSDGNHSFVNGFQPFHFKSESMEKFEFGFEPVMLIESMSSNN